MNPLSFSSGRKVLETRSMTDDTRISQLEEELKEAKWIAEDADRKYDEVQHACSLLSAAVWVSSPLTRLCM